MVRPGSDPDKRRHDTHRHPELVGDSARHGPYFVADGLQSPATVRWRSRKGDDCRRSRDSRSRHVCELLRDAVVSYGISDCLYISTSRSSRSTGACNVRTPDRRRCGRGAVVAVHSSN